MIWFLLFLALVSDHDHNARAFFLFAAFIVWLLRSPRKRKKHI